MKAVVGRALREVGTELKKHGGVEVRYRGLRVSYLCTRRLRVWGGMQGIKL